MPAPAAPTTDSNDPCAPAALQSYQATYSDVYNRWSVALIAAGRANPADLKAPVDQLQSLADEFAAIEAPACAQQANSETSQAMKQIIEGYQSLMSGKDVGQMVSHGIDMLSLARARVNALPEQLAPTATALPTETQVPTITPTATAVPTDTPTATATPEPRNGVIDSKIVQVFDSPTATAPIKSLVRGTRVLVFELQKGRLHIKVGELEGWVSQGAVVIR
ncbi:MAG TPA: hypothetical protein VFX76_23225 [Roseiflexaceae bacterium]|nr:hypothetical protein [Roseiflexaceae bacterium]